MSSRMKGLTRQTLGCQRFYLAIQNVKNMPWEEADYMRPPPSRSDRAGKSQQISFRVFSPVLYHRIKDAFQS